MNSKRKRRPSAEDRRLVAEWLRVRGPVCPGYARPEHPSRNLTVDHRIQISKGGLDVVENKAILCRSCNSRKHDLSVRFPPPMKSYNNPLRNEQKEI